MTWGVETFKTDEVEHTDEMVRQVDEALLEIGRLAQGDQVVIIAGSPPGIPGSTNALRIHRMGDAINEVAPAYRRPMPPLSPTGCEGGAGCGSRTHMPLRAAVFESAASADSHQPGAERPQGTRCPSPHGTRSRTPGTIA